MGETTAAKSRQGTDARYPAKVRTKVGMLAWATAWRLSLSPPFASGSLCAMAHCPIRAPGASVRRHLWPPRAAWSRSTRINLTAASRSLRTHGDAGAQRAFTSATDVSQMAPATRRRRTAKPRKAAMTITKAAARRIQNLLDRGTTVCTGSQDPFRHPATRNRARLFARFCAQADRQLYRGAARGARDSVGCEAAWVQRSECVIGCASCIVTG